MHSCADVFKKRKKERNGKKQTKEKALLSQAQVAISHLPLPLVVSRWMPASSQEQKSSPAPPTTEKADTQKTWGHGARGEKKGGVNRQTCCGTGWESTQPLTLPSTSRGSFEFMRTGLTLSPESRPLTGRRLSKMPSNFAFSSTYQEKRSWDEQSTRFKSKPRLVYTELSCTRGCEIS